MTKREIANLCCRVIAVFYMVQAIMGIGPILGLAMPLLDGADWTAAQVFEQVIYAVYPLLLAAAAAFVWRWSWLIAAWMTQYDVQDRLNEPEAVRHHLSAPQWHAIAFSTLGLWVLVDAVPRAVHYLTQLLVDGTLAGIETYVLADMIELLLRLALGTWLLFGASGVATIILRIRTPGYGRQQEPGPQ